MDSQEFQAEEFERNRTYLRTVAQRILGSSAEADDAVQEAWLRVSRSDTDAVENMRGWLTTIVSRICLDMLRTRRARHEELVDDWSFELDSSFAGAPEAGAGPEDEALRADAVGVALLVVLERLAPAERLAFVLHDMFGVPFEEIAPIVDRSVAATRQLASRGRRRVRGIGADEGGTDGGSPELEAERAGQRRVIDAFLAASREGDFTGLLQVLDPDVEFRSTRTSALDPTPTRGPGSGRGGADRARPRLAVRAPGPPRDRRRAPGLVVATEKRILTVLAMTIEDGKVKRMDVNVFAAAERPSLS